MELLCYLPYGGFPGGSGGKESTCNARDLASIPGLGRSAGEGNSFPLRYSGLENSMDSVDHGVLKSWTRLSDFHFHVMSMILKKRKMNKCKSETSRNRKQTTEKIHKTKSLFL